MFDETLDRYLREIALHQELLWKNSLYRKTIVSTFSIEIMKMKSLNNFYLKSVKK